MIVAKIGSSKCKAPGLEKYSKTQFSYVKWSVLITFTPVFFIFSFSSENIFLIWKCHEMISELALLFSPKLLLNLTIQEKLVWELIMKCITKKKSHYEFREFIITQSLDIICCQTMKNYQVSLVLIFNNITMQFYDSYKCISSLA